MRVLYLFSGPRAGVREKIENGEYPRNGFWGMLDLPRFGIEAEYVEPEQYFSERVSNCIRKYSSVYFVHLLFLLTFFFYDIIFTSTAFGTQFVRMLLPLKKPLWVMHDFSITGLIGEGKTLRQRLFRSMVSRCAGIVTVSAREQKLLEKAFPHLQGKIEYIPFGVDLTFFKPDHREERQQVLGVGFDPDRDWKTLISACRSANVPLVLATRMSRVSAYLPLPPNVEVRQMSPKELVREYGRSAIVAVPLDISKGTNDAMGCSTLFEGMAMAKPVIATRTPSMESYITHGVNGFLIDARDVTKWRTTIEQLMRNSAVRTQIGETARAYVQAHLDLVACTKKLADFFKKIAT